MTLKELEAMAEAARPQPTFPEPPHERDGCDDYGSTRQVEAENAFLDTVTELLTPMESAALEAYCFKADTEERIDEALRLARAAFALSMDGMIEEFNAYNMLHGLNLGSADEHLFDETLTGDQQSWIAGFCQRWEAMVERTRLIREARYDT